MKNFLQVILIVFVALSAGTLVYAQEDSPENAAKKHGVTFPVSELGNCIDYSSCRTYCEDPVNQAVCVDYAKAKGFYKEDKTQSDAVGSDLWQKAKAELGCDSGAACKAICEQAENYEKCSTFAKSHNLGGGHTKDPAKAEILQKAQAVLGCNSYDNCKALCSDEANKVKCSEFAKTVGLRGGEAKVGPGGCTSHETCQKFCSDPVNYQVCSQYTSLKGRQFSGPGGCSSESSCREYCGKNPNECQGMRPPPDDHNSSLSSPSAQQYRMQKSELEGTHSIFAERCSKRPECVWTGSACQCSASTSANGEFPHPSFQPKSTPQQVTPGAECSLHPGCTWTGSICKCVPQAFITISPSAGIKTGVRGAATKRGPLQFVLDLLSDWIY